MDFESRGPCMCMMKESASRQALNEIVERLSVPFARDESGRRTGFFGGFMLTVGVIVALWAGLGCDKPAPEVAPPPPQVSVAQPIVKDIVELDEYTGRLGAVEAVDVRARVSGYVDSIHFTDGQLVKQGDLLFVIDPRPFAAALKVSEGESSQAKSQWDLALSDFDRVKALLQTKAVSKEDFETRSNKVDVAEATYRSAEARVERAKLDMEFTEVRSPMSGRIGRHLVSVGNLITGGPSDSTLLTNIVSVDPIYAYFDIDEQSYLKYLRVSGDHGSKVFQKASPVQMSLLDESDFTHDGELNFVDNQIDSATGTLRARAVFKNGGISLSPGIFVKIRLAGSSPQKAVLIPDRSVQADQSDRFVYVVGADNVVKQQRVTPGRLFNGLRVVTEGLNGTESVIVDGIQRARPGSSVQPEVTKLFWNEGSVKVASNDTQLTIGGVR